MVWKGIWWIVSLQRLHINEITVTGKGKPQSARTSGDLCPISWKNELLQVPGQCPAGKGPVGFQGVHLHPPSGCFSKSGCLPLTWKFYLTAGRQAPLSSRLQAEALWEFLSFSGILRRTPPPHKHTNIQAMLRVWAGRWDRPLPLSLSCQHQKEAGPHRGTTTAWMRKEPGAKDEACSRSLSHDNLP